MTEIQNIEGGQKRCFLTRGDQIYKKLFLLALLLNLSFTLWNKQQQAVSCSPDAYMLGGVGLGYGMTGKLGCAWVGAWVSAWDGAWCVAWRGAWVVWREF